MVQMVEWARKSCLFVQRSGNGSYDPHRYDPGIACEPVYRLGGGQVDSACTESGLRVAQQTLQAITVVGITEQMNSSARRVRA